MVRKHPTGWEVPTSPVTNGGRWVRAGVSGPGAITATTPSLTSIETSGDSVRLLTPSASHGESITPLSGQRSPIARLTVAGPPRGISESVVPGGAVMSRQTSAPTSQIKSVPT